jgi:hypothetical protein
MLIIAIIVLAVILLALVIKPVAPATSPGAARPRRRHGENATITPLDGGIMMHDSASIADDDLAPGGGDFGGGGSSGDWSDSSDNDDGGDGGD